MTGRVVAIAVLVFLAACASPAPSPTPSPSVAPTPDPTPTSSPTPEPTPELYSVSLFLDLHDPGAWPAGATSCQGTGGYSDIQEGMQITVRDESNQIRGVGTLEGGSLNEPDVCSFLSLIFDVGEAEFYVIESSRRGSLTYTFDEMEANGWLVFMSLGD